jgi:hydrogenase maturation protease
MAAVGAAPRELLILGLGNALCSDDGLGPTAIAHFNRDWQLPHGCSALDGGTLGLSLLALMEDSRRVILVDAVELDRPAGTLVRMEGAELEPAVRERLSVHQVGVADVMDALELRDRKPPTLLLLGAVPETVGLGLGLSPALAVALPRLVERIVAEAARLGFSPERRAASPLPMPTDARALFGL